MPDQETTAFPPPATETLQLKNFVVAGGLLISLVLVALGLCRWYLLPLAPHAFVHATHAALTDLSTQLPPEPRIEAQPEAELRLWRQREELLLHTTDARTAAALPAATGQRLPIEEAMRRLSQSGQRLGTKASGSPVTADPPLAPRPTVSPESETP